MLAPSSHVTEIDVEATQPNIEWRTVVAMRQRAASVPADANSAQTLSTQLTNLRI